MSWSQEIYSILEIRRDFRPDLKSGLGLVLEEHQQKLLELITNAVRSGEAFETEIALRTGLGNVRWLRILGEPESAGGSRRMFGTVQDVTGQRNTEAEMNRLATTDSLTGLPNRYVFGKAIETALASSRAPHGGALLLLDLDDFKDVNDTLGHDAGDHLLKVLAQRLRSLLRRSDSIGRLGGDEFGVFLRGHGRVPDVAGIARLMLESATAPVVYLGHTLHVGASVGVARYPDDAEDAETLLEARRHRPLYRQAWRRRPLLLLQRRARRGGGAARALAEGAAARLGCRTVHRRLPARAQSPRKGGRRLRGAAALEPSGARPACRRQFPGGARGAGARPHALRCVDGARHPAIRRLDQGRREGRKARPQRLGRAAPGYRLRRPLSGARRSGGPRSAPDHAGAHRGRAARPRFRQCRPPHRRAARAWGCRSRSTISARDTPR